MPLLFAATLFLSAALLFSVQPMVAKMILPALGGSPSVWNTCMVFFQAALLGGYLYAHALSSRLGIRTQVVVHVLVMMVAALALPLGISEAWTDRIPVSSSPVGWLLGCLLVVVGLPFFILSSSAPLLQRWFSRTQHKDARDPYFLYSASNLGSLLALLGYPLVMEPWLRLEGQARGWAWGYVLLALMIAACGLQLWRRTVENRPAGSRERVGVGGMGPDWRRRAFWVALAFVPSSLMLGVTTFMTTDIASVPLLWVLPLSLYLLTFVMVFAQRPPLPLAWMARVFPYAALGIVYLMMTRTTEPPWLLVLIHLLFFFTAAMVCHGRLAADRPEPRYLTEFYIWMSVGGVLGGMFNALLAPALFPIVLEYPVAVVMACLLLPRRAERVVTASPPRYLDAALPLALGVTTFLAIWWLPKLGMTSGAGNRFLVAGVPAVFVFLFSHRPLRFGLGVAAVLIAGWHFQAPTGAAMHTERNFFGVSRVQHDPEKHLNILIHGNTFHGRQFTRPEQRCLPLAYYHPAGPCGDIMRTYQQKPASPRVAVIGLGSGAMAGYSQAWQDWTFYEIDPAVIRIAQDTNYFSYLQSCAASPWRIIPGDARLRLREAAAGAYGLIVLDAFSSDAIPMHLMSREALALYRSKLAPDGILAFHISNRYLKLQPVVGKLAADAGLVCVAWRDQRVDPADQPSGRDPSHWAVLARRPEDLGLLNRLVNWERVEAQDDTPVWTDDFSNLISVFEWR